MKGRNQSKRGYLCLICQSRNWQVLGLYESLLAHEYIELRLSSAKQALELFSLVILKRFAHFPSLDCYLAALSMIGPLATLPKLCIRLNLVIFYLILRNSISEEYRIFNRFEVLRTPNADRFCINAATRAAWRETKT